jgi:hypothetical protein
MYGRRDASLKSFDRSGVLRLTSEENLFLDMQLEID